MNIKRYTVANGEEWLGFVYNDVLYLITYLGKSGELVSFNGYGVRNFK